MERIKVDNKVWDNGNSVFDLSFGVSEDMSTQLLSGPLCQNDYVERVKKNSINSIIDYEKHIFYPAYLSRELAYNGDDNKKFCIDNSINLKINNSNIKSKDDKFHLKNSGYERTKSDAIDKYSADVNTITFNLYFRERTPVNNPVDDGYYDYGTWQSEDYLGWNSFVMVNNKLARNDKVYNLHGDLLGYLGFDDDDVYYQKNSLKKSFLRISVYDTPYRQSQQLLHYSTLFFDTNQLYKKFISQGKPEVKDTVNPLGQKVFNCIDSGSTTNLTASFTCSSKYNGDGSSDGFYLYLFNKIVEGGGCTPLFLKFEFNNAKYGKVVPFISPRTSNLQEIDATSVNFPTSYIVENLNADGSTSTTVNMNRFFEDLYVPIFVRYNNTKRRFEWVFPFNEYKNTISSNRVINLYEPRING